MTLYVPDRGDIIWMDSDPKAGQETKRRPALVISPKAYNALSRLVLVMPINSHGRGNNFEVPVRLEGAVGGVVISNQLLSLDWSQRNAKKIGVIHQKSLQEAIGKVKVLLEF